MPSKINVSGDLNYSQELNYVGKVKSGFTIVKTMGNF